MSAPKWTPGPWRVRDEDGPPLIDVMVGDRLLATAYPEHFKMAYLGMISAERILRSYEEAATNACLIAAAPDLYEALMKLAERHADLINSGDCGFWDAEEEEAMKAARAILAKARGGGRR